MKKFSVFLLIFVLAAGLCGCTGNQRLTNMTVLLAVGIDVEEKDVSVSLQYLDINKGTGTNESVNGNITAIVAGKGESIEKALKAAERTLPDKLFYGQNKLLVLTEESENALQNELEAFMSDTEYCRPDVSVVRSVTTAADIIRNKQRGARVPAENICRQLRRCHCRFTVGDYLNRLKRNTLPQITAKDNYTLVKP